jgi:D-alanyl-lipoteichoic acid acyltransferase DltB (MBOAT superfamily)
MLFNSHEFLFVFLPICLVGFFLLGRAGWSRAASLWLSASSLAFYAWWNPDPTHTWNPRYLALLLASIVCNYTLGVCISRAVEHGAARRAKLALALGVTANLGTLAYFKYAAFLAHNLNAVAGTHFDPGHIALPLAISFFTFTQIAYLVDAFHGVTKQPNFRWYLLFVSFFPHLIAGPIVLYRSLMPQFAKKETWTFQGGNFAAGLSLFTFGLFKKVVFADGLAPMANGVFASVARGEAPGFAPAWIGALAYTLQLYFDFSGYSDMAIGLGRMFNVQFPLNFNSPYQARNIAEFWQRWHITLSQFLRDHLYIPLGGNRLGQSRRYVNLMITMLLGGLWHGASWTFVAWGGLHGLYLVVHQLWAKATQGRAWAASRTAGIAGWALTLLAVIVGWVLFRAHTFGEAVTLLRGMAGMGLSPAALSFKAIDLALLALTLGIVLFAPNTELIFRLAQRAKDSAPTPEPLWCMHPGWATATAFALVFAVLHLNGVTEFLYFQF